jgi:hypothetical protein
VTDGSGGSGLSLRSDDLDSVGELYPKNEFGQLVATVEAAPAFLGGLCELEDHGERGLVREAPFRPDGSVADGGERTFDDVGRSQVLPVLGRETIWATSRAGPSSSNTRWAEGKPERMCELAEELVRLSVDVIVAPSSIYSSGGQASDLIGFDCFLQPCRPARKRPRGEPRATWGKCHWALVDDDRDERQAPGTLKATIPVLARVAVVFDPAWRSPDRLWASASSAGRGQRERVTMTPSRQ